MEGADWLRTQLASFECGSCGRTYRRADIRVLAQREELFFVDLACRGCGAQAVAIVTIEVEDDAAIQATELAEAGTPLRRSSARRLERAAVEADPIGADDVLAMHEFLHDFDGDFRRLFGGGPRRPAAPGSR